MLKSMLIDIYSNIDSVIVHRTQTFESHRIETKTQEEKSVYFKLQDKINRTNLLLNMLLIAFVGIIFSSISKSNSANTLEASLILIYSILNLSGIGNKILTFIEYRDRLKSAIEKSQLYSDKLESIKFDSTKQHTIEISSVVCGYDNVLTSPISFDINEKEKVVIVGDNGTGKSTLLKVLTGLIKPKNGTIAYKDDINPYADIGYYAQDGILFNRSILENIIYPYTNDYDTTRVWEIIRKVGLDSIIKTNIDLENSAGNEGTLFSGGEKQKTLIARALYERKKIVFFDEITSFLDNESCNMFDKLLVDDFKDSTVLIVSHTPINIPNI